MKYVKIDSLLSFDGLIKLIWKHLLPNIVLIFEPELVFLLKWQLVLKYLVLTMDSKWLLFSVTCPNRIPHSPG